MNKQRLLQLASAATLCLLAWVLPGETANYGMDADELPSTVLSECQAQHARAPFTSCDTNDAYVTRHLSQVRGGVLYLVAHVDCLRGPGCGQWLLRKQAGGVEVLMSLRGRFEIEAVERGYPVVTTVTEPAANQRVYRRHAWNGARYSETGARTVFHVNGSECGTEDQCRRVAREAMQSNRTEDAVAIWRTVFGVSWI